MSSIAVSTSEALLCESCRTTSESSSPSSAQGPRTHDVTTLCYEAAGLPNRHGFYTLPAMADLCWCIPFVCSSNIFCNARLCLRGSSARLRTLSLGTGDVGGIPCFTQPPDVKQALSSRECAGDGKARTICTSSPCSAGVKAGPPSPSRTARGLSIVEGSILLGMGSRQSTGEGTAGISHSSGPSAGPGPAAQMKGCVTNAAEIDLCGG